MRYMDIFSYSARVNEAGFSLNSVMKNRFKMPLSQRGMDIRAAINRFVRALAQTTTDNTNFPVLTKFVH